MTKQEVITKIEQEIERLESAQEEYQEAAQQFSNLDTRLKARKAKGEEFTKEHPDIKRLRTLGDKLSWDRGGCPDTWYRLQGKIESARAHIELIKSITTNQ
ncbi:MAG: hypothetical protein ACRBFS_19620 [Aureispira sp.]